MSVKWLLLYNNKNIIENYVKQVLGSTGFWKTEWFY